MVQEARPEERHRGAPSPLFLLRWGKRARAIGALGTFLSNPASLAILVPVGLFILALFMLLFATGGTFPPGAGGLPPGGKGTPPPYPSITPPPGGTSCPITGSIISCGSFYSNYSCRHCGPDYVIRCENDEIYNAIDIVGPDRSFNYSAHLPTVFGQSLQWKYISSEAEGIPIQNEYFWGWEKRFHAASGNKEYTLRLLHLNPGEPSLSPGQVYFSGTLVGRIWDGQGGGYPYLGFGPHIHVTISEGNAWLPADTYFKMCAGS